MKLLLPLVLIECVAASNAHAQAADTLAELHRAFARCARVPESARGSILRLRFSMRRDGSLLGQPTITYADLRGDETMQAAFRTAALRRFAACFPIAVTDGLGGAIPGCRRVMAMRF